MGKVKKLRKKYRALCTKAKNDSENVTDPGKNTNQTDGPLPISMGVNNIKVARSMYSISKSSLSGISVAKKDKRRIRHELFLERLEASKKAFSTLKKKKGQKIVLPDDLPALDKFISSSMKTKEFVPKVNTEMKNRNPRKGMMKRRHAELAQNVNILKSMLKNKTLGNMS